MKIKSFLAVMCLGMFCYSCAGNEPVCGNGDKEPGEECDDGNTITGDGCSSICTVEHFCGNGICEPEETHNCPTDCDICGNGVCNESETVASCSVDCYCTNGSCDVGESHEICPQDCAPECGNGTCEPDESYLTCLLDCFCTNGTCDDGETAVTCPQDCSTVLCGNGTCDANESVATCPQDCTASECGNGTCAGNESIATCPSDCFCGNGTCDGGENNSLCPTDCPSSATCGNGNIEAPEQCDGSALGGATCLTQGFDGGTLSCNSNCTFNTSNCTANTQCTIVPQSGCTAGYKCTVDTATTNRCVTAGTQAEMTVCDADSDCLPGLTCAPAHASLSEGVCRRYCTSKTVYSDNNECTGSAGSACYYDIGVGSTTLTNLFLCTAPCNPITNIGCHPDMRCSIMGLDRNGDYVADKYITECVMTALPSGNCPSGFQCDAGYECFDLTAYYYAEGCYKWCSDANPTCPGGYACNGLPDPTVIGGVEYGVCLPE